MVRIVAVVDSGVLPGAGGGQGEVDALKYLQRGQADWRSNFWYAERKGTIKAV